MPQIRVNHVSVLREGRAILQDAHLVLSEHRIGIIGANGSGKSTLLRVIMGLDQPSAGTIDFVPATQPTCHRCVAGQHVSTNPTTHTDTFSSAEAPTTPRASTVANLTESGVLDLVNIPARKQVRSRKRRATHWLGNLSSRIRAWRVDQAHGTSLRQAPSGTDSTARTKSRREFGFLFAEPDSQLLMPTIAEDVNLSLIAARKLSASNVCDGCGVELSSTPTRAQYQSPQDFLSSLGWKLDLGRAVSTLSSGEKQLAALASVLAGAPRVILCDEPATRLDRAWHARIMHELLNSEQQLVIATHDLACAAQMDRVIVMDNGRVVFDGEPENAIAHYIAQVDDSFERQIAAL